MLSYTVLALIVAVANANLIVRRTGQLVGGWNPATPKSFPKLLTDNEGNAGDLKDCLLQVDLLKAVREGTSNTHISEDVLKDIEVCRVAQNAVQSKPTSTLQGICSSKSQVSFNMLLIELFWFNK